VATQDYSADHAGLKVAEQLADAAEVRIVAAAVLAAAADVVPAAHKIPKLDAHLVTALTHQHVRNPARRNSFDSYYTTGSSARLATPHACS